MYKELGGDRAKTPYSSWPKRYPIPYDIQEGGIEEHILEVAEWLPTDGK